MSFEDAPLLSSTRFSKTRNAIGGARFGENECCDSIHWFLFLSFLQNKQNNSVVCSGRGGSGKKKLGTMRSTYPSAAQSFFNAIGLAVIVAGAEVGTEGDFENGGVVSGSHSNLYPRG